MKAAALWCLAVALASALLVAADFRSRDPDSALYARLSGELASQPASRWIAPEWNGAWNQEGLFREHPVGILLPSVLLIRAGFPSEQAAYAVNMLYQVAVILLLPLVARVFANRSEARSLAWVLQLLPVSFVYRIRGNQEHPVLMCFLAFLYATHRVRTHGAWLGLMIAAFLFLILIKAAFAMFALAAAALWLLVVPADDRGSDRRAWAGLVVTGICALGLIAGYEALYVRTTGESFLDFYRSTRLGESIKPRDQSIAWHFVANVGWYLLRIAWFAAPWSLAALAAYAAWFRLKAAGTAWKAFDPITERGLLWTLLMSAVYVAALSPANVRAERFIFPVYFAVGTVGVLAAIRNAPRLQRLAIVADRHWWLPAATWLGTFLLSLGARVLR